MSHVDSTDILAAIQETNASTILHMDKFAAMYAEFVTSMKSIANSFMQQLQALQTHTEERGGSPLRRAIVSGAANSGGGTYEEDSTKGLEAGDLEERGRDGQVPRTRWRGHCSGPLKPRQRCRKKGST